MKIQRLLLTISSFIIVLGVTSCGQKGPLIVEQAEQTQVIDKQIGSPAANANDENELDDALEDNQ